MILEQLGVYGWDVKDENLLLTSILTGDPLIMIGSRGCGKTDAAMKLAEALGKKSLAYDASKAMFDDVLGYPNIEKLKQGVVEYVPSPVTIWDKELVLIDEMNRAVPELQSKWLEIIRSRKIMGFPTSVKWVWSAMNPVSYSGTQTLDDALIGRFAIFLYPPDILQMDEVDRIKVTTNINIDDAPALKEWYPEHSVKSIDDCQIKETGITLNKIVKTSAEYFVKFKDHFETLPEFLARFSVLLSEESNGEIQLDGRRLGFLHRNILAYRSVEFAKHKILDTPVLPFKDIVSYVIQCSIPFGINEIESNRQKFIHIIDSCFELLSVYFINQSQLERVNKIYELFTTKDLIRKIEILFLDKEDIGEMAQYKAWNALINNADNDASHLAYAALAIEAEFPGHIPVEIIHPITKKLDFNIIGDLKNRNLEYADDIENLLNTNDTLKKLIAVYHIRTLLNTETELVEGKVLNLKLNVEQDYERIKIIFNLLKEKNNNANSKVMA